MAFADRLAASIDRCGAPVCVGIDPHLPLLPKSVSRDAAGLRDWSLAAVEAVSGFAAAIKPQSAFFEQLGHQGVAVLEEVCAAARDTGLLVVLDVKRGDIGSTAEAYAIATLDDAGPMRADAVTLSPYLGAESLDPWLARCDAGKGIFVLLRTSNPGAGAWQAEGPDPIARKIATWVADTNASRHGTAGYGPVGVVVGATLPGEARAWREALPDSVFLIPGVGAQGGSLAEAAALCGPNGHGGLINSSRAILFGPEDDYKPAIRARAQAFRDELRGVIR